MNFRDLQEELRLELVDRIGRNGLTGSELARQTGFRQAHVSNFLNRKRALSLEGLDRVMAAQGLSVEKLLPLEMSATAGEEANAGPSSETEAIAVVSAKTAAEEAVVRPGAVIETVEVAVASLRANRWWAPEKYGKWERYVGVRVDTQQAVAMEPLLTPGAIAVIDRHYRSLAPYRPQQRTLYAVRTGSGAGAGLALRYVEMEGTNLILRPLSVTAPVQVLALRGQETPADFVVGRVCVLISEL